MKNKRLWESKKAVLAVFGMSCVMTLALLGKGDPAAYGAIGLMVSVACGAQGLVDYQQQQ